MYTQVIDELRNHSSPDKARASAWFFKTGRGQYGEGDVFIGVTVPTQRTIARKYYKNISLIDIKSLLASPVHEHRLTALIMLVYRFEKEKQQSGRKVIFDFYVKNRKYVNNWDLVDTSAHHIVGAYLSGRDTSLLTRLARSPIIWDRRIAMIATFYEIGRGESKEAFRIAKILLHDPHDLIQKAVGWTLREIGKRCDEKELIDFLNTHYRSMPRTALRYAIERLTPSKKSYYMKR
jgi:3-methyladenine DNA glycosylase AlkD